MRREFTEKSLTNLAERYARAWSSVDPFLVAIDNLTFRLPLVGYAEFWLEFSLRQRGTRIE